MKFHELRCAANSCQARKLIAVGETGTNYGWRVVGTSLLCPLHAGCATPMLEVATVEFGAEQRVTALAAKILAADPTQDEIAVVEMVIERLFGKGRLAYGPLREALDDREFEVEALEEVIDALIYPAIAIKRLLRLRSAQ